ncbi:MAG: hypothetical protein H7840_11660 [Alphaproteobacteria bacterium]
MDAVVDLLSRLYDTELLVDESRRNFIRASIKKHATTIMKASEDEAALVYYIVLKNEPIIPTYRNFNVHFAVLMAFFIMNDERFIKHLLGGKNFSNSMELDRLCIRGSPLFDCRDITEAKESLSRIRRVVLF